MKTRIVLIVVLLGSVCFAGRAWDRWKFRTYVGATQNPAVKDYEQLIGELEQGIKDLEAERDALRKSRESTTFVSVAALRATGYQLERLETPDEGNLLEYFVLNRISQALFKQWIAKAQEWDEKHLEESGSEPG